MDEERIEKEDNEQHLAKKKRRRIRRRKRRGSKSMPPKKKEKAKSAPDEKAEKEDKKEEKKETKEEKKDKAEETSSSVAPFKSPEKRKNQKTPKAAPDGEPTDKTGGGKFRDPDTLLKKAFLLYDDLEYDLVIPIAAEGLINPNADVQNQLDAYLLQGSCLAIVGDSIVAEKPFRFLLRGRDARSPRQRRRCDSFLSDGLVLGHGRRNGRSCGAFCRRGGCAALFASCERIGNGSARITETPRRRRSVANAPRSTHTIKTKWKG
ncbi:MAG: hypothetical protein GY822_29325 [Deltaproteobacteria bacterium]|nr:hypothetical protein [Deltaproteobacteria bacterium]